MMVLQLPIKNLGVDFDAYYENTYLLENVVQVGLEKGFRKDPWFRLD
jgi:hypothetical protein